MTLGELKKFCEDADIPDTVEICFDRGIDLIEIAERSVYNGVEIILYPRELEYDNQGTESNAE